MPNASHEGTEAYKLLFSLMKIELRDNLSPGVSPIMHFWEGLEF